MNKKGQIEMADLAGFILILVSVIIFGYIFIKAAPQEQIEILAPERGNYLTKQTLLDFLSHEIEFENKKYLVSDLLVKGLEGKEYESIKKLTNNLFGVHYFITIFEDNKLVFFNTALEEVEDVTNNEKANEILKELERKYEFDSYILNLENFYDSEISIKLDLLYQR